MTRRVALLLTLALLFVAKGGEAAGQGSAGLELRPTNCKATVTEGARSAEVVCTKVMINTFDENVSSITFVVRDAAGTWHFLQAYVRGREVADAVKQADARSFDVWKFFVFPASEAEKKQTAHLPLQGTCRVSRAAIECRTNDTMLGYAVEASM